MVLHRKQRKLAVPNAFYGTVVQIDVRDFQIGGAGNAVCLSNYRETMVLGGDQHLTAAQIADGMVTSPVPVWQLGGRTAIGQANELVAETDSKRRQAAICEFADGLQCVTDCGWIARSVGKKEAVRG